MAFTFATSDHESRASEDNDHAGIPLQFVRRSLLGDRRKMRNALDARRALGTVRRQEGPRRANYAGRHNDDDRIPLDGSRPDHLRSEPCGGDRTTTPLRATQVAPAMSARLAASNFRGLVPDIAQVDRHDESGIRGPVSLV
jgi:hypothetical protein